MSKFETGKFNLNTNILTLYSEATGKDKKFLLFGSQSEIEELTEWVFFQCFSLSMLMNLKDNRDLYDKTYFNNILTENDDDISLQNSMKKIAEYFGEYNIKIEEFPIGNEVYLDDNFESVRFSLNGEPIKSNMEILWKKYHFRISNKLTLSQVFRVTNVEF
ncbi:hypothetical protein [Lactococcus formosensis]|uniref:hypothetical protein n=1 Tax=Lactococcus formosensis TaxID=1281486 RepID=UPI0022E7D7A8|nr:hypothetical protein [Lactococcus formosensis]